MRYGHLSESGPCGMENVGVAFVQTKMEIYMHAIALLP